MVIYNTQLENGSTDISSKGRLITKQSPSKISFSWIEPLH